MAVLAVTVVSADHQVWSGEAKLVVARTIDGELGIMAGHEPVLAILTAGDVRVTLPSGEKITARADEGFLSVEHNTVTVVARYAELV